MSSDTSSTLIEVVPVSPFDEDAIGEVFDLGCRAKATLGPQMRGAYEGAAAKGHLLVAKNGNSIMGFALYGVAYGRVRLAYLCVTGLWRRQGVAHALVDHISQTHHDLAGISVKCRNSYDIDKVWISLGFHKRSEVRGRSQAGHLLTGWWRDHGHPDLFSRPEPPLLRAAIDNNIIRDLGPTRDRDGAADSIALTADHLTDQLELIVTTSVRREIADVEDKPFREACEQAMKPFTPAAPTEADVNQARQELLRRVSRADGPYPASGSDEYDLRHVASAVVAKAGIFVTRDVRLISILRDPARRLGLRILEPADVIVHIDELLRADAYRPMALLGTGYQLAALGAGQDATIEHLASDALGEKRREFMRRIRSLAPVGGARYVILAPDGSVAALYGLAQRHGVLEVPVFRAAPQPLADTIARQVLLILRNRCRDAHLSVIRVSDPHLGPGVQLALLEDGYQRIGGDWFTFVVDHCGAALEIERQAFAAARRVGLPEPPSLRSSMAADIAAKFERKWWPAKIADSALPTYVVSIQQRWSNQLFGVPAPLWRETLGLSREHVYYRSAANRVCRAPGRVLWYMSGDRPSAPGIIACSQLELEVVSAPAELHERFRHLGVWELGHIQEAGTGALRQALRVTGTEIFPNPIPLPRLVTLSGNQRGLLYPLSPRRISSELFARIYQEGFGQNES